MGLSEKWLSILFPPIVGQVSMPATPAFVQDSRLQPVGGSFLLPKPRIPKSDDIVGQVSIPAIIDAAHMEMRPTLKSRTKARLHEESRHKTIMCGNMAGSCDILTIHPIQLDTGPGSFIHFISGKICHGKTTYHIMKRSKTNVIFQTGKVHI
jgi:hypothetical protein